MGIQTLSGRNFSFLEGFELPLGWKCLLDLATLNNHFWKDCLCNTGMSVSFHSLHVTLDDYVADA